MKEADYLAAVERAAAEAPPLGPKQLRTIARLLSDPTRRVNPPAPRKTEAELRVEELTAKRRKLEAKMQGALTACRYCDHEERVHKYQSNVGLGFHTFEPLTPDEVIKTATQYRKKFKAIDSEIEGLKCDTKNSPAL